jgi:hypothetical protein
MTSTFVSETINAPAAVVYDYVRDPANLPAWAPGLVGEGAVEQVDGAWVAHSPMGRIVIAFAEPNPYGVLDHDVTLPDGQVVSNPFRVVPYGDGSELTFALRRRPGMSDDDFAADTAAVAADLAAIKRLLEA